MDDTDTKAIVSELQRAQRSASSGTRPQRRNDRLLDGMLSSPARKLAAMSRSELLEQRERNERMLQNTSIVNTLPDKGAKLKNSIAQIDALLQQQENTAAAAAAEASTSNMTQPNIRQMSLEENGSNSRSLLAEKDVDGMAHSKTRMMPMDESMQLQNEQLQAMKDEKLRRQMAALRPPQPKFTESLADDLSLSMERMKLNPETGSHRPPDDDRDEYESDSEDEDSIDQAIYDSLYEDDEGFDEEYDDRR
ncbi:predicted protein [Lichtheimia corymbifera JMRC:FSU:9682]|uniref:Uncharacterized protein n=1 Tax=Lichtheimia corymbifera JMRC:FSU:9682 TaxID=1263082 RepID=A0A068S9C9_9FUNG|nr:predicted protein [Lichtheimia corymbifera JMRC:FSU:9682]